MESSHEVREREALEDLEAVLRAVGEEMVALRRRAQLAEARVRELERGTQLGLEALPAPSDDRVKALEQENRDLTARVESARAHATQLAERLRFLRQQYAEPEAR